MRRGRTASPLSRLHFVVVAVAASGCVPLPLDQDAAPGPPQGPRLGEPLPGLTAAEKARFERGREIFVRVFTPEEGLGPLFNADACAECHEDPLAGGTGDEIELHAAIPLADGCDLLSDSGGPVFQLQVTPALHEALGIDREPVPGTATTAQRTTPDLFGFGLLDAVPDSLLLALADPDDANGDGISGRVNRSDDGRIGRFGRKATVPTLVEFNAGAFQNEQGITTFGALAEGTVGGQPLPAGVDPLPEPELGDEDVLLAADFVRFLAPPPQKRKGQDASLGEKLFGSVGCAACHVPVLRTGASDVAALAHREVQAYTDLLLHDMGPELADICFGLATPSEFRTEPLMGLNLSTVFLHDGRARSIEAAILLHGGEAQSARQAFLDLGAGHRRALLAFLQGL